MQASEKPWQITMKLCAVYKSSKRADTYLYVPKKNDFEKVPKVLLEHFGKPLFLMSVPIHKRKSIANISTQDFISKLDKEGFYLQLPPKAENLLEEHLKEQELRFKSREG